MKYNDKTSKQFQQRSIRYEDSRVDFWGRERNRKERRKELDRLSSEIHKLKFSLKVVMSKREIAELYKQFINSTNGRWSNMYQNHFFIGSFSEFIEYLYKNGDERIINYKLRLREHNINRLLS